jgi:hypothetical protein
MVEMSTSYSFGVWKTHRSLPVTGRPLQGAPLRVNELHLLTSGSGTLGAIGCIRWMLRDEPTVCGRGEVSRKPSAGCP